MDVMMYDLNGDSVLFCQYIQKLISTIVLPKVFLDEFPLHE